MRAPLKSVRYIGIFDYLNALAHRFICHNRRIHREAYSDRQAHTYTLTHTPTHTYTPTHLHTHLHTHTYTHTHTHTRVRKADLQTSAGLTSRHRLQAEQVNMASEA